LICFPGGIKTHVDHTLNDAWSMGGVHAGLPFHVASPRTKDNVHDPAWGIPLTGRGRVDERLLAVALAAERVRGASRERLGPPPGGGA
jgi:hypothetical protein